MERCKGHDYQYGRELHNGGERLSVVNAVLLSEAASHKSYPVPSDGAIRVPLDLEHPLDVHNLAACRFDDEAPCLPLLKRRVLSVDYNLLVLTLSDAQGLRVRGRHIDDIGGGHICGWMLCNPPLLAWPT